jgi:integrase
VRLAHKHHFGNTIPEALELENGAPPAWLLSGYPDPRWTVTDTGAKTNPVIVFDVALPNGRRLSSYRNLYEGIKRVVYGVRTGPGATIRGGRYQCLIAESLITLARWMVQNRIYRYDELTSIDMLEYAEAAAFGVHNILQTEDILRSHLEALWAATCLTGEEDEEMRRSAAEAVFPTNKWSKYVPVLDRQRLYAEAGLEGVGSSGRRSSLSGMLDDFEEMCGFYQEPYFKQRRLARALLEEDEEQKVTDEHLIRLIRPFQLLYRLRDYLDDAVHFVPFAGRTLRDVAKEMGARAVGRTGTIPSDIAMTMVERATRWVVDYAEPLLDLKEWGDKAFDRDPKSAQNRLIARLRSHGDGPRGPGSPFPLTARLREPSLDGAPNLLTEALSLRAGMGLNTALAFLVVACVVVIAAFSARRAAEICGLEAGCISEHRGHPWLRVFIHKTLLEHTNIPVPEVVAAAVKVLERLSARSRKRCGTKYLLQYNRPATDEFLGLSHDGRPVMQLALNLRRFGYYLDVPETDEGERWVFRMHQFRRFFAVMYIHRYELGDFEALSYHLRHWDPEMTRRYCMEPEVRKLISLTNTARTVRVLSQMSLGKLKVKGAPELVREIQDMRARMDQRFRVKAEHKFQKWLKEKVLNTGVNVKAIPWGFSVDVPPAEGQERACDVPGACSGPDEAFDSAASLQYLGSSLRWHRISAHGAAHTPFLQKASAAFVETYEAKFKKEGLEVPQ